MAQLTEFSWKQANVLIADDEPDMREIFAAWLRNLGCVVTEVSDGLEALAALEEKSFDAVVTDVRMPRVDGIELVKRLQSAQKYIPVIIFVSGFVDLPLPDAFDMGVEAVLAKPCARKDLVAALRRSLLRRNIEFEPDETMKDPGPANVMELTYRGTGEGPAVAVGRGGFSTEVENRVEPGTAVRFVITFSEQAPWALRGWGIVRWCERIEERLRIAVELMYLEDKCRDTFASWLKAIQPLAFIPKGNRVKVASGRSP